ncbi:MAG TPA: biopolymer transporter ExbD [Candidatus Polarisedimenticolaceae bacterium]|nr:biopolymer transporter ExbD [Candidatus Polarisedimenticolaceae bacterium]
MQVGEPEKLRSTINVTPLVDVVLVLLIIFMVMAPQLQSGPPVRLPETDRPEDSSDPTRQIRVTLETDGTFWVDDQRLTADQFPEFLGRTAAERGDLKVVLRGDARLTYGEVKRAMLIIESAGFNDVGLVAEKRAAEGS